ncbi:MAG: dUTP diphosphatase [Clostridia bacterium]|nr:dUTP diphosphatase [Clostridia bacterium]
MKQRGFEVAKDFLNQDIKLPERSTKNSAGYDFFAIEDTVIPSYYGQLLEKVVSKEPIKPTLVKTGIKAYMGEDEVLSIYNRSSNPGKKGLILANSVGIIDSDYYSNPDNDGHIMFAFYNFMPFAITIKKGDKIGQGIFTKFLKADNDNAQGDRTGGFGSTGK